MPLFYPSLKLDLSNLISDLLVCLVKKHKSENELVKVMGRGERIWKTKKKKKRQKEKEIRKERE